VPTLPRLLKAIFSISVSWAGRRARGVSPPGRLGVCCWASGLGWAPPRLKTSCPGLLPLCSFSACLVTSATSLGGLAGAACAGSVRQCHVGGIRRENCLGTQGGRRWAEASTLLALSLGVVPVAVKIGIRRWARAWRIRYRSKRRIIGVRLIALSLPQLYPSLRERRYAATGVMEAVYCSRARAWRV